MAALERVQLLNRVDVELAIAVAMTVKGLSLGFTECEFAAIV